MVKRNDALISLVGKLLVEICPEDKLVKSNL